MSQVLVDHGAPPIIPASLLPYQSYEEDPKWQTRFTIMWVVGLGVCVGVWGVWGWVPRRRGRGGAAKVGRLGRTVVAVDSLRMWTPPGLGLNVGQIFIILIYALFALLCIILRAPLLENPNRAGFLALAQLPPVFLFATKNNPLTLFLLGPGADWSKLNYVHRWSARLLLLAALVHGSIWINNHVVFDLPILTQQKEGSGVAALAALCLIALTSVAPVRRVWWSGFLVLHYLLFPAFFITICYHTIYASPWIFPPLAFYAADLLLRILVRWRVVVGRLEARGERREGGWVLVTQHPQPLATPHHGGQHVALRALVGARAWESHPLSVCSAGGGRSVLRGTERGWLLEAMRCRDLDVSALRSARVYVDEGPAPSSFLPRFSSSSSSLIVLSLTNPSSRFSPDPSDPTGMRPLGLLLVARACGDWTRALWDYAAAGEDLDFDEEEEERCEDCGDADADVEAASSSKPDDTAQEKNITKPAPTPTPSRHAHLILEGPYGGPSLRAWEYERVLLVAGGSGAGVALGVLDEIVGRYVRDVNAGEGGRREVRTRKIVWCWCVRSFGAISHLAPYLQQIAAAVAAANASLSSSSSSQSANSNSPPTSPLELHIQIHVTCLCDPLAVPAIPNCVVVEGEGRPEVRGVLGALIRGSSSSFGSAKYGGDAEEGGEKRSASVSEEDMATTGEKAAMGSKEGEGAGEGETTAVFAAGPASLVREAGNAVVAENLRGGGGGGVRFCAEVFTI
ncbi:iron reductase [Favolaschia claudopus]|uniref:Iron reductase n=1 Tax=Favolaschia claudopus TaxID=2862362 RepID=A0AAV9ZGT4_9AGAR